MKKFLKIVGVIVLALLVLITGALAYVKLALPDVGPAPEVKVPSTQEQIERGR